MKVSLVTTSWDDGHKYDIRLARVLKEYGLSGTFYISPHNREIAKDSLLNPQEISDIGNDFEIGAHTMTHPRLPTLSESQAEVEISESKLALEVTTGKAVSSFCYPGGAYADTHVQLVKDAGFTSARTIQRHKFAVGNPTTIGPQTSPQLQPSSALEPAGQRPTARIKRNRDRSQI